MCKKDYIWNPDTCICANSKYVGSVIDELLIKYDRIIDTTKSTLVKTFPAKLSQRKILQKVTCFSNFFIDYYMIIHTC